jgi:homoserine acetyltransferase
MGHDGFLKETRKIGEEIQSFLAEKRALTL